MKKEPAPLSIFVKKTQAGTAGLKDGSLYFQIVHTEITESCSMRILKMPAR